jgi:hypothetical protein
MDAEILLIISIGRVICATVQEKYLSDCFDATHHREFHDCRPGSPHPASVAGARCNVRHIVQALGADMLCTTGPDASRTIASLDSPDRVRFFSVAEIVLKYFAALDKKCAF